MKNSGKLLFGILVILLVFGIVLSGCDTEPSEPTYTVWTDSGSYAEFSETFGSLSDGYYIHYEFTNSDFNKISSELTNEYKHEWTESQINNWFVGRGFGSAEAQKETAWLLTINHGFIASRSGSIVYMLVK